MGRVGYTNTRHTGGWEQGSPLAVYEGFQKQEGAYSCLLLQLLIYGNQMHENPKSPVVPGPREDGAG